MEICIFYSLFMAEVVEYEGALCSPRQGKREPRLTVDREKMSYPC